MLFRRPELEGIAAGTITLAFRRWDRPRVRPGGRQRTAVGVIAFGGVRLVRTISDEDALRAGQQSAAELLGVSEPVLATSIGSRCVLQALTRE